MACNTVNTVEKNKEAGTSQKQSYVSATRQSGNLVTTKVYKAGQPSDMQCQTKPTAVEQLLARNLYAGPDLLQ